MGSVIFPLYSMYFWWAFIFLSIRLRGKLSSRKMFIFGCKIVHVLCFAVTQLNLAYIVKIERSKTKRTVIQWWTSSNNLFERKIQFEIVSLWDKKVFIFLLWSKIKISIGEEKYILQDVTKPIICLPSISLKNRLIELMLFTLLLLTNVRRK